MRDAIYTGIALILATVAVALTIIFALAYMRGEGWFDLENRNSLYLESGSSVDETAERR
ncbi:hypothetical protein [Hyphobacterium sp.]|jgi:hypothetical protein|uniref:hypothetical protein n=1 Tax=Hyphobacterium sp. TaxID=2004662 RepID=UPI003BAB7E1F